MTTPTRDEFPPRDPRFDAAWRAASDENPPANLDAAILAAARREVGARPQSVSAQAAMHARRRWWPLAAAATVAAIAVGVVQLVTHEELGAPSSDNAVVSDMPAQSAKPAANAVRPQAETATAPTAVPPPPMTPAPAPFPSPPATPKSVPREQATTSASGGNAATDRRASASAPTVATPMRKKSEATPALAEPFPAAPSTLGAGTASDATPPPAAAPAPSTHAGEMAAPAPLRQPASPGAAAQSPSQDAALERREAAGAVSSAAPRPAPAPPPAPAFADAPRMDATRPAPIAKTAMVEPQKDTTARIKDRPPLPVSDWIVLIRRLRDEGNTAAAALELAAFRTAHADHEKLLPPDLRDWRPPEK